MQAVVPLTAHSSSWAMPESPKRKWSQRNTSNLSSDSSALSEKRVKEDLNTDNSAEESSFSLQDSVQEYPGTPDQVRPLSISANSPISTSTPMASNTESGAPMSMDKLMSAIESMLDKKFEQNRNDLINDMKGIMMREINELKSNMNNEVEKLQSDILVLQDENTSLRQKVEQLWADRQDTIDNVNSAKIQSVNNNQYARRTNIIVYGVEESVEDKDNTGQTVKGIIKDKLNISLKSDDIEVSHRLGQRTLNKKRPIVVRFRFRDTKFDIMKQRKNLKGSGVVFGEDLCPEMRDLQKEIKNFPLVKDSWAWNGKLFAKDKNDKVHHIQYGSNWKDKLSAGN